MKLLTTAKLTDFEPNHKVLNHKQSNRTYISYFHGWQRDKQKWWPAQEQVLESEERV